MTVKKKVLTTLSVVLILGLAALGILAYLMDDDSDVNVMTLGNVDIDQHEYDADEKEVTNGDFGDLYPGMEVVKTVNVENIGDSDCYFRTLIAFEDIDSETFGIDFPINEDYKWSWAAPEATIVIDGVTYQVYEAVYKNILPAGTTSTHSLEKVALSKESTNEDMEALGGTYEILVLSQAVQSAGFDNAAEALDEAFGDVDVPKATEWFKKILNDYEAEYVDNQEELKAALEKRAAEIKLGSDFSIDENIEILNDVTIKGDRTITRASGFTGTMFTVKSGVTLIVEGVTLDGAGATATGNLIATEGSGNIVLNAGAVLQNNNGAHAVNLATRGGGTLTLNGASIINNSSDSGAIWGGGHIIVNEGSKINNNQSTGNAGAIRMVSGQNLTMNGGEISNNTAVGVGGAIYGYGSSTYSFNGGKMNGNTAATGGAVYTGDSSVVNIGGTFELCNNIADDAGALRLSNRTAFNMSGGKVSGNVSKNNAEWNGFYGWNPGVNISGGELADDICIQGGLIPTIGVYTGNGVIHFDLSTNHNTANLAKGFGTIKFTVAAGSNFSNFNFKPALDYTYTAGDEAKLICMNEGYSTYWDATKGVFKIKAN